MMKVFIHVKEKSERLPNKNFMQLGGVELYKRTLLKLKDFDVYLDTDSDQIFQACRDDINLSHVTCYRRKSKYIDMEIENEEAGPTPLMIRDFLDNYVEDENEPILLVHVTSPFLKVETLLEARSIMLGTDHDSVCSVSEIRTFTLVKKDDKYEPINFDPSRLQKTQRLDPILHINSAFFVFTKKSYINGGNNRLGKNPYYYPIIFPEDVDINYPDDFYTAERIVVNDNDNGIRATERNLSTKEYKKEDSIFEIGGVSIGGTNKIIIAGPCAVESMEQTMRIADRVASVGANMLRGGAYKPRTSPYSFQGLGERGLEILKKASTATGLPVVTEVVDRESAKLAIDYVDMLQIGTRNMQNFSLLKFVGKLNHPVLLKRGFSATLEEFLMSAEYLMANGCEKIVLCERGIRTFVRHTRNTLDIGIIPALKQKSHLPVIIDPSHSSGINYSVIPHAMAGLAAGALGIRVDVHDKPNEALCDGAQALTPSQFTKLAHLAEDMISLANKMDSI